MKDVNKKEFGEIKYILTSKMRTRLILTLSEKEKNLEILRNELDKPSATILHGLKELEILNYVEKYNKYYYLTSNGFLLAVNLKKLIENWYSLDKNINFWRNHSLSSFPEHSLKNLYQLKQAECIKSDNNDLSKPLNEYFNLIKDSNELKIILPIFSEIHLNHIFDLIKNKNLKKIEIITSEKIMESIEKSDFKIISEKIEFIIINKNIDIFLTCANNFISITLFFKDGYYDDSEILIDKSNKGIEWGIEIFNDFKNSGGKF